MKPGTNLNEDFDGEMDTNLGDLNESNWETGA